MTAPKLTSGVRPQSEVFELAAAAFFVMKGVAAARILGTSWGSLLKFLAINLERIHFFIIFDLQNRSKIDCISEKSK